MALRLADCSPSQTVTLKTLTKIPQPEDQINRLIRISQRNLENTRRILRANAYDGIMVYRFTSKLIPLCTHPHLAAWDYLTDLGDDLRATGAVARDNGMRVSLHPDHFTLLNSPSPAVQAASLRDLEYHANVLDAMKIDETGVCVIHVGGKYDGKEAALERFKAQFRALPERIRARLVVENDDRCFTAAEVLSLCQELDIPMVLDLHHHQIFNHGETLADLLPSVWRTWKTGLPKLHVSSPKSPTAPRSHADYVDAAAVGSFLRLAKDYLVDCDLMIEAKGKDLALFKLGADLASQGFVLATPGEIKL